MAPNSTPSGDAAHDPSASTPGQDGAAFTGLRTLRPGSAIAAGVVSLVIGLALLVPALLSAEKVWTLISVVVLVLALIWIYVVRPCVRLHDEGVRIVNPMRTVDITWPMITEVRSRWVLELLAGQKKYAAWGVPADPKRPRHGRGMFSLGASKVLAQQPEATAPRPKIEAQAVALEIESRIAADKQRKDGRTPRILEQTWDPAPVGLLIAATAFVVIAFLA